MGQFSILPKSYTIMLFVLGPVNYGKCRRWWNSWPWQRGRCPLVQTALDKLNILW